MQNPTFLFNSASSPSKSHSFWLWPLSASQNKTERELQGEKWLIGRYALSIVLSTSNVPKRQANECLFEMKGGREELFKTLQVINSNYNLVCYQCHIPEQFSTQASPSSRVSDVAVSLRISGVVMKGKECCCENLAQL